MHIGVDARFLGGSSYGLAQYSENLLLALARLDTQNQYTVLVNARLKRRLRVGDNFRLIPVRGSPVSLRGLTRQYLALRRQHDLDLLHVHFPLTPLSIDCPMVITVHDVIPFSRASEGGRRLPLWDRLAGWFLYPLTMSRAKWILCVSHATRSRLVNFFPEVFDKTIVLPSGVEDLYRKKTERPTADLIHARFDVPERYILYSGSSGPSKNIPQMIEAFGRLSRSAATRESYEFVLDLTGDAWGRTEIERKIAECDLSGRVRILDQISPEERHILFDEAALLFIASKDEGFGFPVLKAQLAGVPVVAADSGALPEVCGEGGLLVDPDDPAQMAEMLAQALFDSNLRAYLSEEGRKNADRYSWEETATRVKNIYELLF